MPLLIKAIPELHMNRWYLVVVQPSLVDQAAVICAWGSRQSNYQRLMVIPAASDEEAQALAQKIVERKKQRGYTEVQHD